MMKQEVKIFNIPIVCTSDVDVKKYEDESQKVQQNLLEALDEGYRLFNTHTVTLGNVSNVILICTKYKSKE